MAAAAVLPPELAASLPKGVPAAAPPPQGAPALPAWARAVEAIGKPSPGVPSGPAPGALKTAPVTPAAPTAPVESAGAATPAWAIAFKSITKPGSVSRAQLAQLPPEFAALLRKPAAAKPPTPATWGQWAFGPTVNRAPGPHAIRNALLVGPLEASLHALTGTGAQIAGGLAGLGDWALSGGNTAAAAQTVQRVENALTYDPRTRAGQMASRALQLPFAESGHLADRAGQKVADWTHSPLLGTVVNTAMQGAPLAIGAKLPEFGEAAAPPEVPPEVAAARDVGIKLTPNQAQAPGGVIGRTLESLAGHAKLERALSRVNAETVTRAAGSEIGIPGDTPVNRASISAAKAPHLAVYNEARGLGAIPTDDAFRAKVAAISNPGAGSFGFDVPADIARLKEGYGSLKSFGAGDAVDKVLRLRMSSGHLRGLRVGAARPGLGPPPLHSRVDSPAATRSRIPSEGTNHE